ncbi:NAD-dependent epimerase/dehydratase family protein [Synergistaceae bacterium OttesenSCG-928-D05]|nr:NAD-dependent epimerase/dehydratase family protein [Synergistaceae bacterium OttesenSCG-928-D05]
MKKILITGANSYIGTSFEKWLAKWPDEYLIDTIDMIDGSWREKTFASYDVVFHVAGIAHVSADPSKKDLYYAINRDLAIETAEKAKSDGVRQFIFMSSMIIYGADEPVGKEKIITRDTLPSPADFYGDSKLQADVAIQKMADDGFVVSIMRPPVIYGPGCKGNFPKLLKLANITPIFPDIKNKRSMIYIDNFTECLKRVIDTKEGGVFFPQNTAYVPTKDVIVEYRKCLKKKILIVPFPSFACMLLAKSKTFNKAFGSKVYDLEISDCSNYNIVDFKTSLSRIMENDG